MVRHRGCVGLNKRFYRRECHSFGLVAALFLLALLTVLVTTLLFLVSNDRRSNSDYAEQVRAHEIAVTGVQTMIVDLRQEMEAGSTVITPANGGTVWLPNSAATMKILPISNAPAAFNHLRSSLPFTPSAVFTGPNYAGTLPFSRASALSSTTNYSQDGRVIPYPAFWDAAYLYPYNLNLTAKPPVPSWIYMQRSGVSTTGLTWSSSLGNNAQGNSAYVLGRYAYQLYDEGGLLDLNVAGAPTSLSASDLRSLEGTLAGVDLTQVGMTAQNITDLIQFRNAAILTSYASSITNLMTATNGFMTTISGDNRFLSRGDLIRFAKQDGFTNSLPYLTHFSRDMNAPSWAPAYDATSPYTYRTSATTTGATNRFIASVSSAGETQPDYSLTGAATSVTLAAGQPRIWKRFPLARINMLAPIVLGTATPAITTAVLADFGLTWNSSTAQWVYNPAGGLAPETTILTLDNIPSGRAPNFFELIKAGILSGSLGVPAGTQNVNLLTHDYTIHDGVTPPSSLLLQDPNVDYHVLKIGACIIDQFIPGPVPTVIDFDYAPSMPAAWKQGYEVPAAGIKNLPYIYTLSQYATLTPITGSPTKVTQQSWLEFELWNPHQQSGGYVPTGAQITSGNAANSATLQGSFDFVTYDASGVPNGDYDSGYANPGLPATGNRYIQFIPSALTNVNNYIAKPKTFQMAHSSGTSESSGDFFTTNGAGIQTASIKRRGFYLGATNLTQPPSPSPTVTNTFNAFYQYYGDVGLGPYVSSTNGIPIQLQVKAGTQWIPYQVANLQSISGQRYGFSIAPSNPLTNNYGFEDFGYIPSDPRTTRGGWNATIVAKNSSGGGNAYGDSLFNTLASNPADADSVSRNNDVVTATPPYASGAANERPIILNRQFHTPADMGYAFRDQPWKSLDFRSTNSADAGLLDIFSVYDDPPVTAGHVNLNSAPQPVLKSIIVNSTKNEITPSLFLASDADTIASAFTNWVATTPMSSRAELASFASTNTITSLITNNRKFEREGAIRALSGVGQTRTINLLLDIVAQSGAYTQTSASLNDFHVTAQVHYWAHIAIDRFTGQVVDLQLEPVYE